MARISAAMRSIKSGVSMECEAPSAEADIGMLFEVIMTIAPPVRLHAGDYHCLYFSISPNLRDLRPNS
ncbi:hypothetical protein AGR1A_Cc50269 [Agrobacterium fabacearum CFBP 5771]|nr:hypothetical protein AGR1C_Cc50275 [Agrobacterium fabacearum TT111]CVI18311.1 hypothetical protein AGR1A_Cc50269 [Agrobacterium fabacearum CFBP 5771]